MPYGTVNASRGWEWLVQGWANFLRSPGVWGTVALLYLGLYLLLAWVPFLGQLAAIVLGPALAGGLIYGAREVDAGRELALSHLLQAFRVRGVTGPMLLLGLFSTAVSLSGVIVTVILLGGAVGAGAMLGSEGAGAGLSVLVAMVVVALLWLVVLTAVAAALFYAIPLVIFDSVPPFKAARESLAATGSNIAPLIVFGFLWTMLTLAATLTFGVGFLVLIPVTAGAAYASYREVFIDASPTELAA